MAVLLPASAYVRVLGQGETVYAGTLDLTQHTEITFLRILLFKHGVMAGTEQIRARLHSPNDNVVYLSEWSDVSDIEDSGDHWWGWFTLDFNRQHLSKDLTYRLYLETQGYTESDSVYLSVSLDWPVPQNTSLTATPPLAFQLYGYRSI